MKKYVKIFAKAALLTIGFFFLFPTRAYAYLDAGSGSYIIQIVIGIAIGGALGIKIFWRRIYHFFKKSSARKKNVANPKKR